MNPRLQILLPRRLHLPGYLLISSSPHLLTSWSLDLFSLAEIKDIMPPDRYYGEIRSSHQLTLSNLRALEESLCTSQFKDIIPSIDSVTLTSFPDSPASEMEVLLTPLPYLQTSPIHHGDLSRNTPLQRPSPGYEQHLLSPTLSPPPNTGNPWRSQGGRPSWPGSDGTWTSWSGKRRRRHSDSLRRHRTTADEEESLGTDVFSPSWPQQESVRPWMFLMLMTQKRRKKKKNQSGSQSEVASTGKQKRCFMQATRRKWCFPGGMRSSRKTIYRWTQQYDGRKRRFGRARQHLPALYCPRVSECVGT